MKDFSLEDAKSRIKGFNKPVDEGVYVALANFMVIANRLNAVTIESCHGHVDWIFPYPNISLRVVHPPEEKVPFWRFRRLYKKYKNKKSIYATLERRVKDTIFFLVREFLLFHRQDNTDPRLMFTVIRTERFSFRVVAAFPEYSRGLRCAGMLKELDQLMIEQRHVLAKLSEFVLRSVETITSLDGVDRCDCDVCRMKN